MRQAVYGSAHSRSVRSGSQHGSCCGRCVYSHTTSRSRSMYTENRSWNPERAGNSPRYGPRNVRASRDQSAWIWSGDHRRQGVPVRDRGTQDAPCSIPSTSLSYLRRTKRASHNRGPHLLAPHGTPDPSPLLYPSPLWRLHTSPRVPKLPPAASCQGSRSYRLLATPCPAGPDTSEGIAG